MKLVLEFSRNYCKLKLNLIIHTNTVCFQRKIRQEFMDVSETRVG